MKKRLFVFLTFVLALAISACGSPEATPSSHPTATTSPSDSSATEAAEIVTFADPVLEAMVRGSMGKPDGDITLEEAKSVTRLDLSGEWQSYLSDGAPIRDIGGLEFFENLESLNLSNNEISDIAPLAALTKLKLLDLSGCAAQDYAPLSALTNLEYLTLENSSLSDVTPLIGLTSLKYLFLEGCPVSNFFPLEELYQGLLEKDFTIAYTLYELGFYLDNSRNQAFLDSEGVSVRLNHLEWGPAETSWMADCVRTVFEQNGYKIDIGYYPNLDAYVVMAYQGDQVLNYVYDHPSDTFVFGMGDRDSTEEAVRAVFTDVDPDDILLTPVRVYHDLLTMAIGVSAETLFKMPYDENDHSLPTPFTRLGFTFLDYKGTYYYEEQEPHELHLYIHRSEFDTNVLPENRLDWNMEFFEADVNGYSLQLFYYEVDDSYLATLEKDGVQTSVKIIPATGEPGDTSPDPDTARQTFNDAFGTEGDDFYNAALKYFEQVLQDRFDMGIEELYAMEG